MVPFSRVTSPWVKIKPQYKYILGRYKITEECQKTNAEQQSWRLQQPWSGWANYTQEELFEKPNKFN